MADLWLVAPATLADWVGQAPYECATNQYSNSVCVGTWCLISRRCNSAVCARAACVLSPSENKPESGTG